MLLLASILEGGDGAIKMYTFIINHSPLGLFRTNTNKQ